MNPSFTITQDTNPSKEIALPAPRRHGGLPLMDALDRRRSVRSWSDADISDQQLADLLWASFGINNGKPLMGDPGLRTAPTARNHQEIELYVFLRSGIYRYDAGKNALTLVREGDHRPKAGMQEFFAQTPLSVCVAADYDKMTAYTPEKKDFYSAVDAGYVSQNIYLYCAAAGLATVACGRIDRDSLGKLLHLGEGRAILSHPIGHAT